MDYIPDKNELQDLYGLSKVESEMYVMKLRGEKYDVIAHYHNVAVATVKQTIYNATKKIKGRDKMMIVVSYDARDGLTRKCTAEMVLRILERDLETTKLYMGKYTMVMMDVPNIIGDTDFIKREVVPYCDILAQNENDVKVKGNRFYDVYLSRGGKKGELGTGFLQYVFNRFNIRYEIY